MENKTTISNVANNNTKYWEKLVVKEKPNLKYIKIVKEHMIGKCSRYNANEILEKITNDLCAKNEVILFKLLIDIIIINPYPNADCIIVRQGISFATDQISVLLIPLPYSNVAPSKYKGIPSIIVAK